MAEFDGFEFIVTEEEDVMLMIYARKGNPENPMIEINEPNKSVILHRNPNDVVLLENIEPNTLNILREETALLIAEVAPTENPSENELKQVYEAAIKQI